MSNDPAMYVSVEMWAADLESCFYALYIREHEVVGIHGVCGYQLIGASVGSVIDGLIAECACVEDDEPLFIRDLRDAG